MAGTVTKFMKRSLLLLYRIFFYFLLKTRQCPGSFLLSPKISHHKQKFRGKYFSHWIGGNAGRARALVRNIIQTIKKIHPFYHFYYQYFSFGDFSFFLCVCVCKKDDVVVVVFLHLLQSHRRKNFFSRCSVALVASGTLTMRDRLLKKKTLFWYVWFWT